MTQTSTQTPTITVKPQPNVYSVLLMAAVVVLAITIVACVSYLTGNVENGSGYGLTFDQIVSAKNLPGLPAK
jgi:hypothetical protein